MRPPPQRRPTPPPRVWPATFADDADVVDVAEKTTGAAAASVRSAAKSEANLAVKLIAKRPANRVLHPEVIQEATSLAAATVPHEAVQTRNSSGPRPPLGPAATTT